MKTKVSLSFLGLAASTAGAQAIVTTPYGGRILAPAEARYVGSTDTPRAVIGVTTSSSTGARDTLGLLVSVVTPKSPADKAGIEEGNRIASINGVNLRLAAADLGDPDTERLMGRRLTRELDKLKAGDDVELKVYGSGQMKTVKIKTVDPDSLYNADRVSFSRDDWRNRPTLGIGLASTGSKRDTLGVFVMTVDDSGPAAKAGLEEGARIAAINGVDLRVAREDLGDDLLSSVKLNRLNRELEKVKAGDAVDLRVYQNGQIKNVKVTTVPMGSLERTRSRNVIRTGPVTIIRSPDAASINIDAAQVAATARRAAETAATVAARAIGGFSGYSSSIIW
jgi:predicted metalloprotease with PDZ domain